MTNRSGDRLMRFFAAFLCLATVIIPLPTIVRASTYLPLEDPVYEILTRLEAEGVVRSGLLSTRPISRAEAFRLLREAERNVEGKSGFLQNLVRSLQRGLGPSEKDKPVSKPLDALATRYLYSTTPLQALNYNNNGDTLDRGSNLRIGLTSRFEDLGLLSLSVTPEYRYSSDRNDVVLRNGYGVIDIGWDLVLGKDSQWWGPGRHGALLLTNNAESFTMAKFANPEPVTLPWIFRHLGPFGFTFFVTNLDKGHGAPEPYLWGMRIVFKPHPNLEVGLERTAFLGGGNGMREDATAWFRSLTGLKENTSGQEAGDQRAGGDVKWTIPWQFQPIQLYLEAAGEDMANYHPNPWAFVGGIYLPRLLNAERFDLRCEYAITQGTRSNPRIWYLHHIYTTYTYRDYLIGHHIGTDADDLYLELSYRAPEIDGRFTAFYDREEHNLGMPGEHETKQEIGAGLQAALSEHSSLSARYIFARIDNLGNSDREPERVMLADALFTYEF